MPPSIYGAIIKLSREVEELEASNRWLEAKLDEALKKLDQIIADVEPQPATQLKLTLGKVQPQ
jgi:hypothetical protein